MNRMNDRRLPRRVALSTEEAASAPAPMELQPIQLIQASGARMAEIRDGEAALVLTGPSYFPAEVEAELVAGGLRASRLDELERLIASFAFSLRPVFDECARVLSADGTLVLQTRDVRLADRLVGVEPAHRTLVEAAGLVLFARQTWWPVNPDPRRLAEAELAATRGTPRPPDPEVFLTFRRRNAPPRGEVEPSDKSLLTQMHVCTERGRLVSPHRHQAPLPMLRAIIRTWTKEGDLVVDPFAGGASTLVIAGQLGRRAMGYEIDPEAFVQGHKNIEPAEPQ